MTSACWCVLVSAHLPIVWTALAKFSGGDFAEAANRAPRDYLDRLSGWRKRAHWAQLNGFEAFPPFAAAVIIAQLRHVPQSRIDMLAIAFVVLRLLHGLFYIIDRAQMRSLVWFGSVGCVIMLFVTAGASAS
jgi:uncharacterized MAPEG superfamily protein